MYIFKQNKRDREQKPEFMACPSARQSAYTKTKHEFTVHRETAATPSTDTNKAHFENPDSS